MMYTLGRRLARPDLLAIKLPDLTRPPLSPLAQVPYVPDFWDSARPKTLQRELPKLHVVSGSVTHCDGGPTYNLEKNHENDSLSTTVQPDDTSPSNEVGLRESLGHVTSFRVRRTSSKAGEATEDESHACSRPLTADERRGLQVLLGIMGGSWLLGWLVEHRTRNKH